MKQTAILLLHCPDQQGIITEVTKFITDNFDNVLGVTWFLQLCDLEYSKYGRPMTNSQIEEIYSLAPDDFRENPMIKNYMDSANK